MPSRSDELARPSVYQQGQDISNQHRRDLKLVRRQDPKVIEGIQTGWEANHVEKVGKKEDPMIMGNEGSSEVGEKTNDP
jgi:hypothetical protein